MAVNLQRAMAVALCHIDCNAIRWKLLCQFKLRCDAAHAVVRWLLRPAAVVSHRSHGCGLGTHDSFSICMITTGIHYYFSVAFPHT